MFTLEELLDTGLSVLVQVDTSNKDLVIPSYLKANNTTTLEIGYNLVIPIPDLNITEDGFSCTLSFKRVQFHCFVPWDSIIGYGGDAYRHLLEIKNEHVEQASSTTNKKPSSKKDKNGKVIRPSWLKVVK